MEIREHLAETVVKAVASGKATTSTSSTLRTLLNPVPRVEKDEQGDTTDSKSRKRPATTSKKAVTSARRLPKNASNEQSFNVHEDTSTSLSAKAKQALATSIVNAALKFLSHAIKSQSEKGQPNGTSKINETPRKATDRRRMQVSPIGQRVLQPRSGNSTPTPCTPKSLAGQRRGSPSSPNPPNGDSNARSQALAVAECASHAFDFLLKPDANARKDTQLEKGLLVFCTKLVDLKFDQLAVKKLRVVQRRLESPFPLPQRPESSTARSKPSASSQEEKDAISSLVELKVDDTAPIETLSLATAYQLNVLRCISNQRKPAVVACLPGHLPFANPNSPACVIQRYAKVSGNVAKAAQQLEVLSRIILNLCPGISSSKDELALDSAQNPPPHNVFELQSIALQIQNTADGLMGKTASHPPSEVFSKNLTAYLRRAKGLYSEVETYEIVRKAYHELQMFNKGSEIPDGHRMTLSKIHRNLCILAESVKLRDEAMSWVAKAIEDSATLEETHALRIAMRARRVAIQVCSEAGEEISEDVSNEIIGLKSLLGGSLTGTVSDLDVLMIELSHLLDQLISKNSAEGSVYSKSEFFGAVAGFAARQTRAHSGVGAKCATNIIDSAVSTCRSTDQLSSWVTRDAAQIMAQGGVMRDVAKLASSSTLTDTWASSRSALILSRILKGLMHRAVRLTPDASVTCIFDDDTLQPDQRGALLEWQLMQAMGHFRKGRYHLCAQQIIPNILTRLNECYDPSNNPLRRARVATQILRKAQEDPELIPSSVSAQWRGCQSVDDSQLGDDGGLSHFVLDVNSSLQIAKVFMDGYPEPASLSSILGSWSERLENTDRAHVSATVNDMADMLAQLKGIGEYFAMFGCHQERLRLAMILLRICESSENDRLERSEILLTLAQVYLDIQHTDPVKEILVQVEESIRSVSESSMIYLQYHICCSEHFLAVDDIENCRDALKKARSICDAIQDRESSTCLSKKFQLLANRGRLIESKLQLTTGSSTEALKIAKGAARLLNAIWSGSERSNKQPKPDYEESEFDDEEKGMQGLVKGVSQLDLKAKSGAKPNDCSGDKVKGAAFWPLVPVLCETFSHLSTVLVHHGLFRDALYCLNQAVKVASTGKYNRLFPQMLIRRSALHTAAGQLEAAELDLTTAAERTSQDWTLAQIHLLRAQAGLRLKEGLLDHASNLYQAAEHMVEKYIVECRSTSYDVADDHGNTSNTGHQGKIATVGRTRTTHNRSQSRTIASTKPTTSRSKPKALQSTTALRPEQNTEESRYYLLRKMEAHILLERTLLAFKAGGPVAAHIVQLQSLFDSLPGTSAQRQVEFHGVMRKVATAFQKDVSLTILPESTLALPALIQSDAETSKTNSAQSSGQSKPQTKITRKTAVARTRKTKVTPTETLESLLLDAASCLTSGNESVRTTAEVHLESAMVSSATMLLSATSSSGANDASKPAQGALAIEVSRINAAMCRSASAKVEAELHESKGLPTWPSVIESKSHSALTAADFQEKYINILPEHWTTVSLCLSEDTEDLYISRYKRGSSPLILRLPFARHKPDGEDDEPFDFSTGKAELQDIVELNNYTCHQPVDGKNRTARDKWWNERESLDRRLEELLINMENIWLGGFKGVFAQRQSEPSALEQFRAAFESVLDRHLPSRNGAKRNANPPVVNDAILELFTGLRFDDEGETTLDEPLTDLLYFIVDMLQFSGERNAYDEIDFDTMSVDVFDALRTFHRATEHNDEEDARLHTILVLDKRLQAFPWESLPCLDGRSVSRVDSLHTLRERVLCMRDRDLQRHSNGGSGEGCYQISRNSGSYILNPSGDLRHTEESLAPVLATLGDTKNGRWSSIVKREPTEKEFQTALDASSMLLYFGHGAATQYIRPRAIRQLKQCSEVVWLMGCSSGSVTEYDELEPSVVPLEYLVAAQARDVLPQDDGVAVPSEAVASRKCMAVLATLWDVTDKDIDRFSLAVGDAWNLWTSAPDQTKLPTKTPRKREAVDVFSTPRRDFKTPKTPKVWKTPAPGRTPAKSRSRPSKSSTQRTSLVAAVAQSRDVCYLRYLNGAAPVVYGVPVYLEN